MENSLSSIILCLMSVGFFLIVVSMMLMYLSGSFDKNISQYTVDLLEQKKDKNSIEVKIVAYNILGDAIESNTGCIVGLITVSLFANSSKITPYKLKKLANSVNYLNLIYLKKEAGYYYCKIGDIYKNKSIIIEDSDISLLLLKFKNSVEFENIKKKIINKTLSKDDLNNAFIASYDNHGASILFYEAEKLNIKPTSNLIQLDLLGSSMDIGYLNT